MNKKRIHMNDMIKKRRKANVSEMGLRERECVCVCERERERERKRVVGNDPYQRNENISSKRFFFRHPKL